MNIKKQQLLLEYLVGNADLWNRCQHIVKPDYWDPELRPALEFIIKYHTEYKALPDPAKIEAESDIILQPHEIGGDTFDYTSTEIETFCRNKAVEFAIKKGPALLAKEDWGTLIETLKDAISVSLHRDIGLDYFKDVEGRLIRMRDSDATISTGWSTVDRILGGGMTRKEMLLFLGGSGVGKSIAMLNIGKNLLEQGYNGVYYTFELAEDVVARRLDMMISGVKFAEILDKIDYVAGAVTLQSHNMGKLLIKQLPASTTTALDLSANLKEIELEEDFTPDFIIIDYLDLMAPTAKVGRDNLFISEKYIAEEIRNLGFEFDAMIITASQMNRSAIGADTHDHSMISGGLSKINTAGWVISLAQNETQKNAGEIMFQFLKTRSSAGVGTRLYMSWNKDNLVIRDSTRQDIYANNTIPRTGSEEEGDDIIESLAKNTTTSKLKGLFNDDD